MKDIKFGITGIGIISPLGSGKEINWQRLINSESQVRYDKQYGVCTGSVRDFKMQDDMRQYEMAKKAILEAMKEADIRNSGYKEKRIGFCIGESKLNLFNKVFIFENTLLERLKKRFRSYGTTLAISAACATGTLTIIEGCSFIENGLCDAVICGSAETSIHPLYVSAFKNMNVLAKHNPSPFDENRGGFAIAEGACFVIVEDIKKALRRGAKIYCEIKGFSSGIYSNDTLSLNSHRKIKDIIKRAANSETPDYIHMHGSGTKLNDYYESVAVAKSFENAYKISLSSTKAATGHMLGVSGMAGAVFSMLAIKNNIVPPTLNFKQTDINLGLDYTPNKSKKKIIDSALSLSFGFGGQGSALFLKKLKL
ncbi:beta-ketoacyl-[acyl-carrier-protein] synthase family protein [Candidatus Endomicrobiellum agilis]|uniref:beta-ketoacyl-[acyl-carrier-protein] synthase family protein n=1 Tax=Candidatus Endomicrobiellum agilis TaxID=3238957 RepID=UPI003585EAAD|nr:beta-ketoacyl-[acyl-carrier-protein] synthase family protein [Endomicrobium sp.]